MEIGQSMMKRHRHVWLIYATWEDVCTAIVEENDYINFINNRGKTVGRGPTQLQHVLKERTMQCKFIDAAIDAIETGNL